MKKINKTIMTCSFLTAASLAACISPLKAAYQIEEGRTGSITLYKYVSEDGHYIEGNFTEDQPIDTVVTTPIAGVGFKYLKIGDLVQVPSTVQNNVGLYYTLTDSFINELQGYGITVEATTIDGSKYYTAEAVNEALKTLTTTTASYGDEIDGTQTPTERMLSFITTYGTAMTDTDAAGKTTVDGLAQGLYIIGEYKQPATLPDGVTPTMSRASAPFLMPIPMTNVTMIDDNEPGTVWQYDLVAYPKSEQIVIRKDIVASTNDVDEVAEGDNGLTQTTDKQIGEYVEFLLTLDVPALQPQTVNIENTNRKYVVSDTLSDGLTIDSIGTDNFTVTLGTSAYNGEGNKTLSAVTTAEGGPDYVITANDEDGGNGFTLTMTEEGLKKFDELTADSKLYIRYSARLNEKAADNDDQVKVETNEYKLTYGTSVTKDVTIESNKDIRAYTYEVNIQKTFTSLVQDMTSVTFTIDRVMDYGVEDSEEEVKVPVEFVKEYNGVYHVYDNKEVTTSLTEEVSVNADGHLSLKGLDDGIYEISEIKTVKGYNLLREPIRLTITGASPEDGTIATSTIFNGVEEIDVGSGLEDGCVNFEIVNNESIHSLHTGGDGVNPLIYIGGALFMVIGGVLVYIGKKTKESE